MHIIAHADAHGHGGREPRFGASKILGIGQFFQSFIAVHHHDVMARRAENLCVVRGFARHIPSLMRRHDRGEAEGLGRLHPEQSVAGYAIGHASVHAAHQRIGDGQHGDRALRIV